MLVLEHGVPPSKAFHHKGFRDVCFVIHFSFRRDPHQGGVAESIFIKESLAKTPKNLPSSLKIPIAQGFQKLYIRVLAHGESRGVFFFCGGTLFDIPENPIFDPFLIVFVPCEDLFMGATGAPGETREWPRCALKSSTWWYRVCGVCGVVILVPGLGAPRL